MAKADVTALVTTLANSTDDTTATGQYYDDIVEELGFGPTPLTSASYVAVTQGTRNYTLPTAALKTLAVFYDDTQLYLAKRQELATYDENWRTRPGPPAVAALVDTDQRTLDLIPVPDQSGDTVGGATPFTTFPSNNLTFIYSNNASDVHSWEELPIALDILAREFGRDSDHYDQRSTLPEKKYRQRDG